VKKVLSILVLVVFLSVACNKEQETPYHRSLNVPETGSFLPMQIGNYWRIGSSSFTEIQDTLRFNQQLYYKFYSLVGGDVMAIHYLRIDDQNQLWEGYPGQPGKEYLHAKFDANVNDIFYTLNDQTWNDYKIRMIEKTENTRVFEWDMVYHPNLRGQLSKRSFRRGLGWSDDQWDSVRINGIVYRR
jgi:hypothetical protein